MVCGVVTATTGVTASAGAAGLKKTAVAPLRGVVKGRGHNRACEWARGLSGARLASAAYSHMSEIQRVELLGLARGRHVENITASPRGWCLGRLSMSDGPVGLAAGTKGMVALASELSVAATFDRQLAYRYGVALGSEARSRGVRVIQGPGIDVGVYPGWGRNFENLGDNVGMAELDGRSLVAGIDHTGTVAMIKHFGVYTSEIGRNTTNHIVSLTNEENVYWAPFRVTAGIAGAVMCSVGRSNGVENCANREMFAQLRSWGFRGFIRSDEGGAPNEAGALQAGVDLIKPFHVPGVWAHRRLKRVRASLKAADIAILTALVTARPKGSYMSKAAIVATNNAVAENSMVLLKNKAGVLPLSKRGTTLLVTGELTAAGGGSSAVVTGRQIGLARAMRGLGGVVNVDGANPLGARMRFAQVKRGFRGTRSAVVITSGEVGAVDISVMSDEECVVRVGKDVILHTLAGTLSGVGARHEVLFTLRKNARMRITWRGRKEPVVRIVHYKRVIAQAVHKAREASRVVVVVGERDTEGLDRVSLLLPGYQNQLIAALAGANKHVVVVVTSGGPVLMGWAQKVSGVVEAWYPGQSLGVGVARVLYGVVNPSGKLPMAFPATNNSAPRPAYSYPGSVEIDNLNRMGSFVGQYYYGHNKIKTLFDFGFGLSYTKFSLDGLSLITNNSNAIARVTVTNTGSRTGRGVVEAYLKFPRGAGNGTDAFVGDGSVMLKAGETRTVSVHIPGYMFMYFARGTERAFKGRYTLRVAQSFEGQGLSGQIAAPLGVPR